MDLNNQWTLFKKYIRDALQPEDYRPWLESLQLVEISSKKIVIAGIPHALYKFDIKKNYDSLFRKILTEVFPEKAPFHRKKIEYCVGDYTSPKKNPVQTEFNFGQPTTPQVNATSIPSASIESGKTVIPSKNKLDNVLPFPNTNTLLDSKYTLNSFVAGQNNLLAYRASQAVAQAPGMMYNPFVLYGGIGVGKTHLLHAIGQEMRLQHPERKIIHVMAEDFLNDFLSHLNSRKMAIFRQRYREADALLIDDLQELAGAEKCQEELLHTLNTLLQYGKQVIITSKKAPGKISTLEKSLRSRLESGLIVDIKPPNIETRMAILERKAIQHQIYLPLDVSEYIARYIYTDIGKMEGALTRLSAHSSLLCEEISLGLAETTLGDLLDETPAKLEYSSTSSPSVEAILQRICMTYDVSLEDLSSNRRNSKTVKARQVSIFLLKELTDLSLNQIGETLNRTHSAILHSLKQVQEKIEEDEFFRKQIWAIKQEFRQDVSSKESSPKYREINPVYKSSFDKKMSLGR